MIFNYIKLAFRLLARNPFFTFINILGLSLGFAVFIVLWQYSQTELKSDRIFRDWDRIYRIATSVEFTYDKKFHKILVGFDTPIHAVTLVEKAPQIESFTRIYNQDNFNSKWIDDHTSQIFFSVDNGANDENQFVEKHVAYADPNIFDFFGIGLVSGDASRALKSSNAVVISRKVAHKYFGYADPIGKIISLNHSIPLKVTGIFENLPRNTHMEFDIVLSLLRLEKNISEFKVAPKGATVSYLKLRRGVSMELLDKILADDSREQTFANRRRTHDNNTERITLQSLSEIAFSNLEGDHFLVKSKTFLMALNSIALIILIVAWINYINLTLSANIKRTRELATRKSIGARPADFIKQFVLESSLVNIISFLVALTFIQLSKGVLELLFDFHVYDLASTDINTWGIVLTALVIGVLITGIYPAVSTFKINTQVLSRLKTPIDSRSNRGNGLVVIQYTCALVLIIGAFAIQRQLTYILSQNIGINRKGIVVLDLPIKRGANFKSLLNTFKNEVGSLPFVDNLTVSNNVVGDREENGFFVKLPDREVGFVPDCNGGVDENYLSTYNIKLLAGRNFLADHPSDTSAILISTRGAQMLHYDSPEDIIGLKVLVQKFDYSTVFLPAEIIGVFEDYKRDSFFAERVSSRKGIDVGIALTYGDHLVRAQDPRKLSIKLSTHHINGSMDIVKSKYDNLFSGSAFNWNLLDDNINSHYADEKVARNQIILFSGLVIIIACLGLLGMLLQRIMLKTKEIGVRKVMGAKTHHISRILLGVTMRHIAVAAVFAIPVSRYFIDKYLQRFSARVYPQWWHYAIPVLILIAIMLMSVSVLVLRASRRNPVDALRYE
ncbi:MAG: ABC transporter permease [Chryseolinea sp.]